MSVKLNVKVYSKNGISCDYYDLTPNELYSKCCIYSDGQIVFYDTLTEQEKNKCWKRHVCPYDIYNYECFHYWEADDQTQGIVHCSIIVKMVNDYHISKMNRMRNIPT